MNRKRFTPTNVLTLPTKARPYQVWDHGTDAAQGLGVLVSPNGIRTFRAVYYYPGSSKSYAMKLGRVGELALDDARERTREVRGLARKGLDPKQGDPARSADFKGAVKDWTRLEQIGRKRNKSAEESEAFILHSTKGWHVRPVAAIRKGEIEELLHIKRDMGHGYAANRLHAHLLTFFRWCVRTDRIAINPMAEMPKPWNGAKRRDREWFKREKADDMIRTLWRIADAEDDDEGRFVKLLLITGKRKEAIASMSWEQIMNDWTWEPIVGNKRKRCHAIPLPSLAQKVLGKRKRSGLVMPDVRQGRLIGLIRRESGVEDFILHGVRHIVETKLAELKVPSDFRDMVLDHAPVRGAGKDYDHHEYRDEVLAALETWCAHLEKVVRA